MTIVAQLARVGAMGEALLFPFALVLEVGGIFAVWNWSRRHRSIWWLVFGLTLGLIVISLIVMSAHDLPKQAYAGFFGMYLFAALAWAWWLEGLSPIDWKAGEVATAVFAVSLFSIASSGHDRRDMPVSNDTVTMAPDR